MEYQLPQKLFLLGSGRHVATRLQRRKNNVKRRVARIGDLIVRPGRRVDVTPEFVAKYLNDIVAGVEAGIIIVCHSADRFMDRDELKALVAVVRGEDPEGPITKDDDDSDPLGNPDDDDTEDTDPVSDSDPEQEPQADSEEPEVLEGFDDSAAPNLAELGFDEPQNPVFGAEPEPEQPEESFEPESALFEAPVSLDEPEVEKRWLPEGFEKLTKKELLALATERKLDLDPKRTNVDTLVRLLKEWRG